MKVPVESIEIPNNKKAGIPQPVVKVEKKTAPKQPVKPSPLNTTKQPVKPSPLNTTKKNNETTTLPKQPVKPSPLVITKKNNETTPSVKVGNKQIPNNTPMMNVNVQAPSKLDMLPPAEIDKCYYICTEFRKMVNKVVSFVRIKRRKLRMKEMKVSEGLF